MLSKLALVAIVAVSQVGILSSMIVLDSLPYAFGETIRLKVMPVDPRDMFRGDYSILSYEFTNISGRRIADFNGLDTEAKEMGRELFVQLVKDKNSDVWSVKNIRAHRPTSGTYLRGTMTGYDRLSCGIEAFFVQEGRGRQIDDAVRNGRNVEAEVVVWRGQAKLKQVIVK